MFFNDLCHVVIELLEGDVLLVVMLYLAEKLKAHSASSGLSMSAHQENRLDVAPLYNASSARIQLIEDSSEVLHAEQLHLVVAGCDKLSVVQLSVLIDVSSFHDFAHIGLQETEMATNFAYVLGDLLW